MTTGSNLRLASIEDADAIDALMKASIRAIFPAFYDSRQTESAVRYIGAVDRMLVADATYFVIEEDGELIACGRWSRRDKLYTGFGHRRRRREATRSRHRACARSGDVRPRR